MTRLSDLRVLWTEGLLLGPTHLQQLDRYHEGLLAARLAALDPIDWGIVKLDIDRRSLASGTFRLERFMGVLPSGSFLDFDQADPEAPPSRPVEGLLPERPAVEVWMGVPREREGILQVGERARYSPTIRRLADVFTAEAEPSDVEVGLPNVRFLFGHENRDDWDCLQIGEVRRDSQGAYILDETYIPPALQISGSDVLCSYLDKLLHRMETRRRGLLASRRERDAHTVEADATDVTRFVLLHTLSQALPTLHQMSKSREVSPRQLHYRLLDLLGGLSSFSVDASIEATPFDHTDLRATFATLFARLDRLLSEAQRESCFVVKLDARQDGMHLLELEDKVARCDRFLLSVATDVQAKDTGNLVPTIAKVASWAQISGVLGAAIPGAKLTIEHRPPPEVPVRANEIYFTIDQGGEYWTSVLQQRNLAVFLPRPFDPSRTQVQLVAIPSRGQSAASSSSGRAPSNNARP